jgi:hypothetical protein
MGFWDDLSTGAQVAFPVSYLANKPAADYLSNKLSGASGGGPLDGLLGGSNRQVPTQFQDYDRMQGLMNAGFGQSQGAQGAAGGQDITHYQAPQLQMGDDPFRRAQLQQMQQLQGIASGQQQGAGELAVQRQAANALAAQQAQARMARGGNAALAYRNAANQSAAIGSNAAGMGQQAALQDQMNAQGLLGQIGASGRSNDINVANANAGYQAGANQLNSGNYLQLLNQLNQQNIAKYNADLGIGAQQNAANAAQTGGLLAGIGGAIGTLSDERVKTDVSDARGDIDRMLDGLSSARGAVSWRYKDPKHGEGRWDGVMAQDLERSAAGKRLVTDTPEGKMVDVRKAAMANLAASARLHERLKALETGARKVVR